MNFKGWLGQRHCAPGSQIVDPFINIFLKFEEKTWLLPSD